MDGKDPRTERPSGNPVNCHHLSGVIFFITTNSNDKSSDEGGHHDDNNGGKHRINGS